MNGPDPIPPSTEPAPAGEEPCLALDPGHPLTLQTAKDGRPQQATVLGVKPGEFLIVRAPGIQPRSAAASGPLMVRLEEDGLVSSFESSVLMALKVTSPLLILSYPERQNIRVLRGHPRVKCLLPALVEGREFVCQGSLHDISQSGCLVSVVLKSHSSGRRTLRQGDEVAVHLPVEGLRIEKLRAQVRTLTQEDGATSLGLSFTGSEGGTDLVTRIVDSLRLAGSLRDRTKAKTPKANPGAIPDRELRDATASVAAGAQIPIRCREPIDLQFTGSHLYDRSSVLGVDRTEMVIAEVPLGSGLRSCPKPGMGLRARFEAHGSYYGFMTSVIKFITKPRPMVFFGYPKKIEVLMRRKHPRISCLLPIRLANEHLDSSGYVTDLSLGGCRVLANLDRGEPIVNVMSGDKLELVIPLDGLHIEKLPAQVRSLAFETGHIAMGLTFALSPKQSARLGGFLDMMERAPH